MRRQKRYLATVAAAIAGVILTPVSAHAHPYDYIEGPPFNPNGEMDNYPTARNYPLGLKWVIEAPVDAWGVRTAVQEINQFTPLFMIRANGATCAEYPERVCVKMIVDDFGASGWEGQYTTTGPFETGDRLIYMNTYYNDGSDADDILRRKQVSCHELMHAFGFYHHKQGGCLSSGIHKVPSNVEMLAINEYYEGATY